LSIFAPRSLPEKQYQSMRRTLDATRFRARLRSAVQEVFKRYPSLGKVTFTIDGVSQAPV